MFNVSTILRFSIQLLLLWCFIGNVVWSAYGSKRNVIKIVRGEMYDSPPIIRAKGNISRYGPTGLSGVNAEIIFGQDLPKLKINGVFWIHSKDGELQTALYNNTLNVCEFLEHPTRNRLLHYILLEIRQRSNLPTKCPIRPGTYYIRNATFERTRVPSFLPASYFRVDINLLDGNPSKMLLTSRWYGQLIKV